MPGSNDETAFKQTQADILTKELDINEFIPEARQIKTNTKNVIGAINYLHGQYQTAILNANEAQRTANNVKTIVDEFMANPPKDGKSAFEIANELQPEDAKFKDEQEWVDSIQEIKADTLEKTQVVPVYHSISTAIAPSDWVRSDSTAGGYTYTIQNELIKSNQDIELIDCQTDENLMDAVSQITCDSVAKGKFTIHIPGANAPDSKIELTFNLKEYVLREGK